MVDLGNNAEGLSSFENAIRLSPKFVAPHLNAAAVLIHLQRYEDAQKHLAIVIKLNPKEDGVATLLKRIPRAALSKEWFGN